MKKLSILTILLFIPFLFGCDRNCIEGNCVNGQGTYNFRNGDQYIGEWKDNKFHGQGTYTVGPNSEWAGNQYIGEYKDGKKHGQGTLTGNGDQYIGEFKDGKFHGQGTYTFADGREYIGEWKDDKKHGQGTLTGNGDQYIGEYKDGKKHGQGTYNYSDGRQYIGEFKDGKFHGQGTYTYSDGSTRHGWWEDDVCKYPCTVTSPIETSSDSLSQPDNNQSSAWDNVAQLVEGEKEAPLVGIQCDEDHRAVIYGFESEDQLVFKNLRTLQKIPESINVWNLDNTFSKKIFTYRNFDGFQDSSVYNPIREVLDAALVFDDAHANYEILKEYKYDGYDDDFAKSRLKDRKKPYQYIVSRVDFSIIHSHPTFELRTGRVQMRFESPDDYFWGGISLKDASSSCVQKDAEELAAYMDAHDKELKEESEQYKQDTLKKRKF